MAVAWRVGAWRTNSWVGMNAGPPNAWRGATTTTQRRTGPVYDTRIMRDDEEMMKTAVLLITMIDP